MVPHTRDGRVMFAIPWHGHTVVGTTDTPIAEPALEPSAQETGDRFILETAALYLHKAPTRADVLSVFAGIRPLVRTGDSRITAALSRDHTIDIDASGLLTTAGGKWTTYRHMAEDAVDQAVEFGRLPERQCVTRELRIHGFQQQAAAGPLALYGADADAIRAARRSPIRRSGSCSTPSSRAPGRKCSGLPAPNLRGRWRTFSPAGAVHCSSMPRPPSAWRRLSPRCSRESSGAMRPGSARRSPRSKRSQRGYMLTDDRASAPRGSTGAWLVGSGAREPRCQRKVPGVQLPGGG